MQAKYDKIGVAYNSTRKADPFLSKKLIEHLDPKKDGVYLDIGCGTGNYTNEVAKQGIQIIGIDPSGKMLSEARQRNPKVDWQIGTAEEIDGSDETFDGIMASLTIHHWTDLQKAFAELQRVLKADGRIVIFTSTPSQMKGYWLNHYFPKMLNDSIVQMPSLERVESAMNSSGLQIIKTEKYFIKPDLIDQFLYCGKQNPELYFNEQIRKGISSFSALANRAEIERGLTKLRADIDSGKINEIMKKYENDMGDYLFLNAEKKN
ncbi:MAG: MerR family transcriptional regulator [Flavobacteriales bacterium]|nr:MerR family transcriptional regulator [Flavobacteriales bacterium]